MAISKPDRTLIKKLSRSSVEQTLAKMDAIIDGSHWLTKSNRYSRYTVQRLSVDTKSTGTLHARHLAQYIAASSILHCADGWSYLGRAINCLLKGDPHRVVHLAYYAELRAALSLLASEGVGIFQGDHFAIDAPHSARKLPSRGSTHQAAWNYLDYWATLKRSGFLFSEVVSPGRLALSAWFASLGGIEKYVGPQARSWFRQWSMDLGLFSDDRDARNESSYRPDGIPASWYLSGAEALTLATELWEVCEPSQSSLFENIDRHILRLASESAFKGICGVSSSQDPTGFTAFITSVVDSLAFDATVASAWKHFLLSVRPGTL